MAANNPIRTRSERVAIVELPPGRFLRALVSLKRGDVLARLALAVLAALAIWIVAGAGLPPFGHRLGDVPHRDIIAKVPFQKADLAAKEKAKQQAADKVLNVYDQDPASLVQLEAKLRNTIGEILAAATLTDLGPETWGQFALPPAEGAPPPTQEQSEEAFEKFREAIAGDEKLNNFQKGVEQALAPFHQRGLLATLPPEQKQGDQERIFVQPKGQPSLRQIVRLDEVLIGDGTAVRKSLKAHLSSEDVSDRVFAWLQNQLPETLTLNLEATRLAREAAIAEVTDQFVTYEVGHVLAKADRPLTADDLVMLDLEHSAVLAQRPVLQTLYRSFALFALILSLYAVCGFMINRRAPKLIADLSRLAAMLATLVLAVSLARWLARDAWRAELIPVLLFGLTMAIAYGREIALWLSVCVALVVVLAIGQGIVQWIVLVGIVAAAVLWLDAIRSRSKLLKVGFIAGLAAFLLTLGAGVLGERPTALDMQWTLLIEAGRSALWAIVAGFLITGLLPFIERLFSVLTEISLLELGDVAHPLLQELVRRAPGTYNHSINVASIAEAAAESIGARGLLVRVGAYFHDIGKMLKPGYFIENQGPEASRHESLVPAMSTLIIIAHIKDGSDLARKHRLPQPIIDFIEQHHGTTLVEYFFRRASEHSEANPDAAEVEEDAFRYPGPKPQTREAGVLMLADAVESASRALVEPGPARIEGLVRDIAMKRLLDGQFDECGLDLSELRTVQDSLIKSLTAVYHGRVKYPDQRTA